MYLKEIFEAIAELRIMAIDCDLWEEYIALVDLERQLKAESEVYPDSGRLSRFL